jgi:hypothetical protein
MVHHLAARTFALLPRTSIAALPSCSRRSNYRNYTTSSFYNNRELEHYASREAKRLSLRQLVRPRCCCSVEWWLKVLLDILWAVYDPGEDPESNILSPSFGLKRDVNDWHS